MTSIDFKTSDYFSRGILLSGMILGLAGVAIIFIKPVAGVVIILVGIVITTTHYRLEVDFSGKVFRDYLWMLGFKIGDEQKFERIEYLFITKSKTSQVMNSQVSSSTVRKDVYNGYLKFSEKDKLHLLTEDSKKDLIKKLEKISKKLNVEIVDYSDEV